MAAVGGVGVLLQPEGVDAHGGAAPIGRATQDTVAGGVVDVELCVVGACVPTDEVIKLVVGQGRGGAAVGAAGDVAPAIVATGIDLPGFAGPGGTSKISSNLMNAPFYGILMIHSLWLEPPFEQENEFFKSLKIKCDGTQPIDIIHKVKLRIR